MDVNVAEKRKFDRETSKRQVRSRMDSESSQIFISSTPPAQQSQSIYIEEVSDEDMPDIQSCFGWQVEFGNAC